jgi:hypothetical protein
MPKKVDFKCRACGKDEYEEIKEWSGKFGPVDSSRIVGYRCKSCTIRFDDPEKFSIHSINSEAKTLTKEEQKDIKIGPENFLEMPTDPLFLEENERKMVKTVEALKRYAHYIAPKNISLPVYKPPISTGYGEKKVSQ